MLHTSKIIRAVADELSKIRVPLVVDPVMIVKSGARLLVEEAIESLKSKILPLATVVTPNRMEAEDRSSFKALNPSSISSSNFLTRPFTIEDHLWTSCELL